MFIIALSFLLNFQNFSSLEEKEIGLIITNYYYDQWGRRIPQSRVVNSSSVHDPYFNRYNNPYSPKGLPGADPDRFDDLFYQNQKRF